jgi:hypothetical protein
MATTDEMRAAAKAIDVTLNDKTSQGEWARYLPLALSALEAAEKVRMAAMEKLFGPDVLAEGSDFVDRSGGSDGRV